MGERAYMLNEAIHGTDPATVRLVADRLVATGRRHGLDGDDLRDWALDVADAIGLTGKSGPGVSPTTIRRRARAERAAAANAADAQDGTGPERPQKAPPSPEQPDRALTGRGGPGKRRGPKRHHTDQTPQETP